MLGLREVGDGATGNRDRSWGVALQRAAYDEAAAVPIKAGKDDLTVKVEVLWAFAE